MRPAGAGAGALEQARQASRTPTACSRAPSAARRPRARPRAAPSRSASASPSSASRRGPASRKYSAIAVARNAPRMRTSGGWSDVATTTTERASPSGPRSRSMNSRTSRPRSPTSAMTLTSARVLRAIMPSSALLPTPEPAKMPRRWPRPQVSSVLIARTPRSSGVADRRALERVDRADRRGRPRARPRSDRPPSIGTPSPSSTRPRQRRADADHRPVAGDHDAVPRLDAGDLAERHQEHAVLPKADDLGGDALATVAALDPADAADRQPGARALDHESDDVGHAAAHPHRVHVPELLDRLREVTRDRAAAVGHAVELGGNVVVRGGAHVRLPASARRGSRRSGCRCRGRGRRTGFRECSRSRRASRPRRAPSPSRPRASDGAS